MVLTHLQERLEALDCRTQSLYVGSENRLSLAAFPLSPEFPGLRVCRICLKYGIFRGQDMRKRKCGEGG